MTDLGAGAPPADPGAAGAGMDPKTVDHALRYEPPPTPDQRGMTHTRSVTEIGTPPERMRARPVPRPGSVTEAAEGLLGIDPSYSARGTLLPVARDAEGDAVLAWPEAAIGAVEGFLTPGHLAQGGSATQEEMERTALETAGLVTGGALPARTASGVRPSLGMGGGRRVPATGNDVAEAAARNRAADPSLTVLPDDLAARATLGLPMDEASRMTRARDQGFETDMPLYHGSAADIPAFDPSKRGDVTRALSAREGFFLAPGPATASDYASLAAERTGGAPVVYPVVHRAPARGRVKFSGGATEDEIAATLDHAFNDLDRDAVMLAGPQPLRSTDSHSIVVKDPANIRSRFARFDPALADSPNLLASIAAWPFVGLGAASLLDEDDAR